MFRILQDSLFNPVGLVKKVNKSGWFIFLCLLVMAIFMSLGTYVVYASYQNSTFDDETVGCRIVDNNVVCDGENYSVNTFHDIYGINIYFLNEDMTIDNIGAMEPQCIVIQGDDASFYINGSKITSLVFFDPSSGYASLEEGMSSISRYVLIVSIVTTTLMNLVLITVISLIGSLMFLKYKTVIRYRKLFKLVVYGVFPIALLITFFNLLRFSDIVFFILAIFAYRTLFVLNRELYKELIRRSMPRSEDENNVIESYKYEQDDEDTDEDN